VYEGFCLQEGCSRTRNIYDILRVAVVKCSSLSGEGDGGLTREEKFDDVKRLAVSVHTYNTEVIMRTLN
jgi:hypothetical protein